MDKKGLLGIIAVHRAGKNLDEVLGKDKDYQEALVCRKEKLGYGG